MAVFCTQANTWKEIRTEMTRLYTNTMGVSVSTKCLRHLIGAVVQKIALQLFTLYNVKISYKIA